MKKLLLIALTIAPLLSGCVAVPVEPAPVVYYGPPAVYVAPAPVIIYHPWYHWHHWHR